MSVSSSNWISKSFFPNVEDDELTILINLQSGSPFSRTEEVGRKIQSAGYQVIEFYRGKDNAIKGILLMLDENKITTYVNLHDPSVRDASAKEIANLYRDYIGDVPDAENFAIGTQIGRDSTAADLEFNISSQDSESLISASEEFMGKLRSYDSIYDVNTSLNSAATELQISLKPNAEKIGLTLGEISRQLRQAYYGEEVQRLPREGDDVKVMVHYPKKLRRSVDSLTKFRIRTPDGREIGFLATRDISR